MIIATSIPLAINSLIPNPSLILKSFARVVTLAMFLSFFDILFREAAIYKEIYVYSTLNDWYYNVNRYGFRHSGVFGHPLKTAFLLLSGFLIMIMVEKKNSY